jgi:hypothetical protein
LPRSSGRIVVASQEPKAAPTVLVDQAIDRFADVVRHVTDLVVSRSARPAAQLGNLLGQEHFHEGLVGDITILRQHSDLLQEPAR